VNRLLASVLVLAFAAASCNADPVHDNEVAALGGEAAGVGPGENHRPGQPCLVCHGGEGPASLVFAAGGTVYDNPTSSNGVSGVTVTLLDAQNKTGTATTNSVGNFFLRASDYAPSFPVDVTIEYMGSSVSMETHIGRDASCGSCHYTPPGPGSPGHVYTL
jgi:hypothetical protein